MKVYIWGTCMLAMTCLEDLLPDIELLGFVESKPTKELFVGKKIISGKQLLREAFDYVILANGHEEEILNQYVLDNDKVVHYRMLGEVDENEKVLCYRKGGEKLKNYLFKSQRELEIVEQARKVMPYISVETDDMAFVFNNKDVLIPNLMVAYGKTFSREEMEFVYEYATKYENGYFLEIGANVGTSSIYFKKKLVNSLQYICFEPLKENVKCLKINCILNECEDILVENVGISNKEQEQDMYIFDGAYGSSMVCSEEIANTRCKFVTLDNYVDKSNIDKSKIAYIWVDVQGHELEVVEGAIQTLKDSPASLYIEFNINIYRNVEGKVRRFLALLSSIYKKFIIFEQFEKGDKRIRDIEELYMIEEEFNGDIECCNILFTK